MRSLHLVLLPLVAMIATTEACPLQGYWKSNEKLTIESFRKSLNPTEKQKKLFENKFFGKLFVHIDCSEFTSVMDGWSETVPYAVVSSSNESVVVHYKSTGEVSQEIDIEAKIEGECYSLPINGGQFREYFCPVSKEAYNNAFNSRAVPDGPPKSSAN
jgi:hypothetical protein